MRFNAQPFLENDVVKIRPLVASDFEALYALAADPVVWQQRQNTNRHTKIAFTAFFEEAIASKSALTLLDAKKKYNRLFKI